MPIMIDFLPQCGYNERMENGTKIEIRYVRDGDKDFWFELDRHLSATEFHKKVRDKQGYVISANGERVGILRYNLFWDNTPFCTMLFVKDGCRSQGYGKLLTERWESDMLALGYGRLLVSTRADELAQHFYRAIGYVDCGSMLAPDQPTELFLSKSLY